MNTIDKNRQSGFGKVAWAWLGCAVLFTGLALPAYGQTPGISSPACNNAENPVPIAGGTGGVQVGADASSFAAGCGADASTDGSVAIGDNAKVNEYLGEPVTPVVTREDALMITGATDSAVGEVGHADGKEYFALVENAVAYYYESDAARQVAIDAGTATTTGKTIETLVAEIVTADAALDAGNLMYNVNTGITTTIDPTPILGKESIAIGADTSVTGDNSIAIGAGSTVGTAAGADPATDPAVANNNGVAIGAGAKVTGHNGIAIGAGVTAGENEIVIGTADQTAVIGGVDLAGIATNTGNIATNTGNIATNTGNITTNTAGIATNKNAIDTNRSGIAMSVALAHLPTIKGGGWGIAAGTFESETAVAVGAHFSVQQNAFIKVGAASSGGETSFGIGYGKGF